MWGSDRPTTPPGGETVINLDAERPQHSTPEQRIAAGSEIATFEDLDGLPESRLLEIMQECPVEPPDPDICVPCRAYTMVMELRREAADQAREALQNPTAPKVTSDMTGPEQQAVRSLQEPAVPEGDPVAAGYLPPAPAPDVEDVEDVRYRISEKVQELENLVQEAFFGPPIPPRDVSMQDLAALTVAASLWVKSMDARLAEGFTLTPEMSEAKTVVEAVIAKVKN